MKGASSQSRIGIDTLVLGQELIERRLYGSDLSPYWLNISENYGGRATVRLVVIIKLFSFIL